jgi:hypothetical protein|tara:strand:+ start:4797 stop:5342 length:546 start_codon:yes stop_codon:yes gene_type:complete
MKNLFLVLIASLLSIGINAQEELLRLQVAFSECHCFWPDADQSFVTWEVWAEPEDKCSCWYLGDARSEKPYLTDSYIANEIALNKEQTDLHEGDFMLWFNVYKKGIYHIIARDNRTGEVLGNTFARVGYETVEILKTYGDYGSVYYEKDFVLVQLKIDDEATRFYGGGCFDEFLPPNYVFN